MYKIAISGKAKSGKNTIASLLISEMNLMRNHKLVAFADPIKEIIKTMFPDAKESCLYGPSELRSEIISENLLDKHGNKLTYRQALIDIGSLGRSYNENIWVNCLLHTLKESSCDLFICSDVRFLNEFNALKNEKFIFIRVLRNDCNKINDVSETEQEKIDNSQFDIIIENNGSINDLRALVSSIIPVIK